jgi:RNA polymerase sigma factor (TIGR02999 family)
VTETQGRNGPSDHELTRILKRWESGDHDALAELMPQVVDALRRIARGYLRREPGHTLAPTALVNELYLRLAARRTVRWTNRAQFFAFAATAMRRILVDHARLRDAAKRGDGALRVTLDPRVAASGPREVDLLALDQALVALARMDPRQARVVELRYFGGLTVREAAEVLEVGEATVVRDWASARAWLFSRLTS